MSAKRFHEIYLVEDDTLVDSFKELSQSEHRFIYYMYRAELPFTRIARDQNGYYSNEIIELFEFIYCNRERVKDDIVNDVMTYLVYLWTNNGVYFLRENVNNKRTPGKIGLKYLNRVTLVATLENLGYDKPYEHLLPVIFDEEYKSTLIVKGSIEKSGNNIYGPGVTDKIYEEFSSDVKNKINAYFYIDQNGEPAVTYYSVNGKYAAELSVAVYWLKMALLEAQQNPQCFDEHIVASLKLLVEYFENGDEEKFRQHCVEWLKTNSRIDYTLGFIETYNDPKNIRGDAGGDITVKIADMEKLNPVLLDIETRLPYPREYRRTELSNKVMNVSVNRIMYSSGHYGPLIKTAAYCLPNYEDIRSQYGSKQIIYKMAKGLDAILDRELSRQFKSRAMCALHDNFDPNDELFEDLWNLQVLLHETIGHASGKLHRHTFVEGDCLNIGNKEYKYGDIIDVTDENVVAFLGKNSSALEELRAEINALYMAITEIDILSREGLFKNWHNIFTRQQLQEYCIISMARHIFRRYATLPPNFTEITGAHTMANVVITNCLLMDGAIKIVEETKIIQGREHHILDIEVIDLAKAIDTVTQLVRLVQHIKSTGNTRLCKYLFDTYLTNPVTMQQANCYRKYLEDNRKALIGDIKATSRIYPHFIAVVENNQLVNVEIEKCHDIFQQNMDYKKIMMTKSF